MKTIKKLLPLFLVLLAAVLIFWLTGRTGRQVKKTVRQELELLKNLDSETTQKYISYEELFPDAAGDAELSGDVMDVCELLFQKFDYKIKKVTVDSKNGTASVSLKLTTLDAGQLARDYRLAQLKAEILRNADSGNETADEAAFSLADSCQLLKSLLTENDYPAADRSSTAELIQNENGAWEISRTSSLENDLTGGLVTGLSDQSLVSASETLTVYLDILKDMDEAQMSAYLGVESLQNTDDDSKNAIALALAQKVHDTFNYEILESTTEGYEATVSVEITSFDSDAILSQYQSQLDTYLASADAVIDGSSGRYEKSYQLLLSCIEEGSSTCTTQADFRLTNDGVSWKLADSSELGTAIFGSLASALAEDADE